MSKINTLAAKKLSRANLKADRFKNYFAGSIIALAAFLSTVVLTFGYNSLTSLQNDSDFQAIFYEVSPDEVSRIEQVEEIDKVGLYLEVGREKQEERSLSILYTDQTMMDLSNARIVRGKFPTQSTEIAIEAGYFSADVPTPGIGDRIVVEFRNNISKKMQTNEFIISGLLQTTASGSTNRVSYNALVSKAFIDADPKLSKANYSAALSIENAGSYGNKELKAKIRDIGEQLGFSKQNVQINNMNVDTNNLSGSTVLTLFGILLVIGLACWVVIYNIFYLSIAKQVKQYGQLRALGATRKQIKTMVKYEGRYLSRNFIPVGVILGGLMSWGMSPSKWMMLPSLFLAIATGLFTALTVRISLNAPAKYAAKISPIEAIRYIEADNYNDRKKEKKSLKRLTPFTLAGVNLSRSRKKTVLALSSLILSGILFISFATLLNSVDAISRAQSNFPNYGKFVIQINDELSSEMVSISDLQSENQLSESLKVNILSINGVNNVIDRQHIEAALKGANESEGPAVIGIENISKYNIESLRRHLAQGEIPEVDSSDDSYILMNSASSAFEYYGIKYAVGDHIPLIIGNDRDEVEHDFKIIGDVADKNSGTEFYLPSEVMQIVAPFNPNQSYEVVVAENTDEQMVKEALQQLIHNEDTLKLISFSETVNSYKTGFRTITITAYCYMIFIALFSLINLWNTVMTTINARRVEIGIMQAIGMDRKQLILMLWYETGFLIVGSLVVSLIAGNVIGYGLSESLGDIGGLSFIHYQFPWKPILLYVFAMLLVQSGVLKFIKGSISRQTVIERLK